MTLLPAADAKVQSCADLNNVRQLDSSCDVSLGIRWVRAFAAAGLFTGRVAPDVLPDCLRWLGKTAEQWGECVGQEPLYSLTVHCSLEMFEDVI